MCESNLCIQTALSLLTCAFRLITVIISIRASTCATSSVSIVRTRLSSPMTLCREAFRRKGEDTIWRTDTQLIFGVETEDDRLLANDKGDVYFGTEKDTETSSMM